MLLFGKQPKRNVLSKIAGGMVSRMLSIPKILRGGKASKSIWDLATFKR